MSVMNVVRRRAAVSAAAGLAAACVLAAAVPAQASPAVLHVTANVSLGHVGSAFTYQFSEAPNGTVYYARGRVVYAVAGSNPRAAILHASGRVLAVAANNKDFFAEVGRTVSEYRRSDRDFVRKWTLPKSLGPLTSAGLFAVGSTVWAWTDWATDESGFQFANVSRIRTTSAVVHKVSSNIAYPADMAANASGLYYEAIRPNATNGYLIRVRPDGQVTKRTDKNIDAPLALAAGRVYLLADHEPSGKQFLDAYRGSNLQHVFSRHVSAQYYDVAGTGAGLLVLRSGQVSKVSAATGAVTGSLSVPHAVTLAPGPSAVVITFSGGIARLLRLAS